MEELEIRAEAANDHDAVRRLHIAAFPSSAEAMLVDDLRLKARPLVSLVALIDNVVVGHILFSPVKLSGHPQLQLIGLAPMAVVPELQRGGVGSALVEAGLAECERLGMAGVVVLGHPDYYPRFGFVPAVDSGIDSDYDVPDDTFMILELEAGALRGCGGRVHYHHAFGNL